MPDPDSGGASAGPNSFRHMVEEGGGDDAVLSAPAATRNFQPIADVLGRVLPAKGRALEVASGTGQHIEGFARRFPDLQWTPNDPDPLARSSIAARRARAKLANLEAPHGLDVSVAGWHEAFEAPFDAVIAINLIHIAPWPACLGLIEGADRLLGPDGVLFIYGCFRREGQDLSPSNVEFDRDLKRRNAAWGVRDSRDVRRAGEARGFKLDEIVAMPANNLSLVLRRAG